jgi:hypothetical protein
MKCKTCKKEKKRESVFIDCDNCIFTTMHSPKGYKWKKA